ncbi:UNVERIFIED_CONTAM: hypothetical protein GTU68_029221 [Idotea baltica]|nr:hypothetical protein [Idotea baltica]
MSVELKYIAQRTFIISFTL